MIPSLGVEKRGSGATVRACDSCRRRKRRCVWAPGEAQCTPCTLVNEGCLTTHVRKPRVKSQKRTRIAEYESRVQRLESLLEERSTSQPHAPQQPLEPADESIPLSTYVGSLRNEVNSWALEEAAHSNLALFFEGMGEGVDMPIEELNVASNFDSTIDNIQLASSCKGRSAPAIDRFGCIPNAPHSLQNITLPTAIPFNNSENTGSGASTPLSRDKGDEYLPPPELGTSLMSEFLVDFNTAVPLYRPYSVVDHIRLCYMGGSDGTALSWASTYIVFGIAHRLRAMSAAASPEDNENADYYLARILEKVSGLLLGRPCLCLVQCLLATAVLIQTSSHPEPHALFVSTALRMAQGLAYNDQGQTTDSPLAYAEQDEERDLQQECRVFWIAFFANTDESILSNAPTAHLRENITTSRPEDDLQDAAGAVTAADGTWRVHMFSLRVQLALLQAEAIEQVLSVKCVQATPETMFQKAASVLQDLETWRKHELFQLTANELLQLLYRSDLIHVLNLEASYFATVFRIQAFLVLGMNKRVNPFSTDALTKLSDQHLHLGLQDAKRLLAILAVAPQGDIGVCWTIKLSVIAALVTVLAHTLHNPSIGHDAPTQAEMSEYGRMLQMLGTLAQKSRDAELQTARDLCMMLFAKVDASNRAGLVQRDGAGPTSGSNGWVSGQALSS